MNPRRSILAVAFFLAITGSSAEAANTPTAAQQTRIDDAKVAYGLVVAEVKSGTAKAVEIYVWSRHWYEAERDAGVKTAGADHYLRMVDLQTTIAKLAAVGVAGPKEKAEAEYYVAEAAVWK